VSGENKLETAGSITTRSNLRNQYIGGCSIMVETSHAPLTLTGACKTANWLVNGMRATYRENYTLAG